MKFRFQHNIVRRFSPGLPFCPGTNCVNWDSDRPEHLNDARTGNHMGMLMPKISAEVLRASPGICSRSIPGGRS